MFLCSETFETCWTPRKKLQLSWWSRWNLLLCWAPHMCIHYALISTFFWSPNLRRGPKEFFHHCFWQWDWLQTRRADRQPWQRFFSSLDLVRYSAGADSEKICPNMKWQNMLLMLKVQPFLWQYYRSLNRAFHMTSQSFWFLKQHQKKEQHWLS